MASRWTGHNAAGAWALAGDAAHNVHPLAGQGLNMGLADVAELARLIRERDDWRGVGDDKLLRRFERSRKAGLMPMATGTDGLQGLFSQHGGVWASPRTRGRNVGGRSGAREQWGARLARDFEFFDGDRGPGRQTPPCGARSRPTSLSNSSRLAFLGVYGHNDVLDMR